MGDSLYCFSMAKYWLPVPTVTVTLLLTTPGTGIQTGLLRLGELMSTPSIHNGCDQAMVSEPRRQNGGQIGT
jgi:hypothetical protein